MVPLRVAFFTDTFQQINGVALTSRQLLDFAARRGYPLLCVRGGERTEERTEGSVIHHELRRSRFSIRLDRDLFYDPVLWRSANKIAEVVSRFRPDIIHVVSPRRCEHAAREQAMGESWDDVFAKVYDGYRVALLLNIRRFR